MINIYTDGSATKNRSGWGWIAVLPNGETKRAAGLVKDATNQHMELKAVLECLKWWSNSHDIQGDELDDVTIWTDSAYVYNCYTDRWWMNWQNNGWVNSKGEPVANKDLWINIITFFQNPQVQFRKIKGHSGHTYNEMADKLATGIIAADDDFKLRIDEKNDKINIELSEILMDYSMKKYPVDETIKRIRKACNCE